jgi:hypothetical protein
MIELPFHKMRLLLIVLEGVNARDLGLVTWHYLTLCMLENLSSAKMSSAEFLKLAFSSIYFSNNTIKIANSFGS